MAGPEQPGHPARPALAQDEVEALRAALMRIADYERNWRESGEVALEDVQSMAREALDHD